jgi:hypothetical protein
MSPGPAHAVYFATYEAVKHAMGGNQAGVHHPLAAGTYKLQYRDAGQRNIQLITLLRSHQWCGGHNS